MIKEKLFKIIVYDAIKSNYTCFPLWGECREATREVYPFICSPIHNVKPQKILRLYVIMENDL